MKTILRAASVGLLLASQALPVFADDSGDDATARRAQRFASEASTSVVAPRMSTASGAVASAHISDDAEDRRAQRFN